MCGPEVLWNFLTLDVAFAMVLLGGSTILRSKHASPFVWLAFGVLSIGVGAVLFAATYNAQTAMAAANSGDAISALSSSC